MKKKTSIIVPVYNEEYNILPFYKEVKKYIKGDYEIYFVDDGSRDETLNKIKEIKDDSVHYITFSRNFGKEAAIYAGLEHSNGDYIVVMDVDLQDPPSLLKEMYEGIEEGYDVVASRRVTRKGEPKIRSFFARAFYKIINRLSKIEMVDGARDYRMMKREVVDAILNMKEYNRYSKGIFSFVGFQTKWLEYENLERLHGETKWSFFGLFRYAIEGITSFSTIPLIVSAFIGLLFFVVSMIIILLIIIKTLIFGDSTSGWPSLVCIIFMVSGIQLLCLGIIGQYLAKTYLEVKNRPIYIMKDKK